MNTCRRVAASSDPRHLVGSLDKGPDLAGASATYRPLRADGMRLIPCAEAPPVLVAG
ncbi:hypothetical protein [Streptomyces pseudovenezuelae]|uniref:hypothetical protein n=1 Tax=Streptomyces pseudovenezuelae TaxID=67350 RepID=UPI003719D708